MAQITKRILSDQVLIFLKAGYPDVAQSTQKEDVYKRIEQVVNSKFAMQQFSQNLPSGETIPNNLAIATYQDVAIVPAYAGKSKSILPAIPVTLPRNAGIQEIRPVLFLGGERTLGQPLIPIQAGQGFLLQADQLLNDLMGQASYEPNGNSVVYSKDFRTLRIEKVDMKLVVFDMSQYSESDVLPIPSDMEDAIVREVIQFFAPVTPEPSVVSNYSTPKPGQQ